MTDNEKLQMFLEDLVKYDRRNEDVWFSEFSLEDLKELRWLTQLALIEHFIKQSPAVFEPIFSNKIDKENM